MRIHEFIPEVISAEKLFEQYLRPLEKTLEVLSLNHHYSATTKISMPLSTKDEALTFQGEHALANCIKDDHQFLMLGDTNHDSECLKDYRRSLRYLHELENKGFKHCVFEINEIFEETAKQYADGHISRHHAEQELVNLYTELNSYSIGQHLGKEKQQQKEKEIEASARQTTAFILNVADCCTHLGLQFHFLDEQCNKQYSTFSSFKRFGEHEERLADKIKDRVGTDKTIIFYGAAHFSYEFALRGHLGASSVIIDLYGTAADYNEYISQPRYRTYRPDYIFMIEDKTALTPCPEYGRTGSFYEDRLLQNFYREKQNHEIEKFERMVRYGNADIADYVLNAANFYWIEQPDNTTGSQSPIAPAHNPSRHYA